MKRKVLVAPGRFRVEEFDPPPQPDYGGPVVRNLLYHVCPAAGNGVWQRNVEQVLRRIDLFNGRRVVAIVTGEAKRLDYKAEFKLDPPEAVMAAFGDHVREYVVLPNDPELREVVTFLPLLERVATDDPAQITFYGHAKGVTRPVNSGTTVHRWADVMYESCLDHLPLVEEQLRTRPITGSFRKVGAGFPGSGSSWHYSGSFWWMRNAAVFSRPGWREVDQRWWGNEAWPGLHFAAEEAGVLFHEGTVSRMDLFSPAYWCSVVEPAWQSWRAGGTGSAPPGGLKVELGGGDKPRGGGFLNVDLCETADVRLDLDPVGRGLARLPFGDESVSELYTAHCLEHLESVAGVLHEIARVCRPGAAVEVRLPHWLHDSAMADSPTLRFTGHRHSYGTKWWWWLTEEAGCEKHWPGPRRLRRVRTHYQPEDCLDEARRLFPHMTDEQVMRFIPGTCHEVHYHFEVVPNERH